LFEPTKEGLIPKSEFRHIIEPLDTKLNFTSFHTLYLVISHFELTIEERLSLSAIIRDWLCPLNV